MSTIVTGDDSAIPSTLTKKISKTETVPVVIDPLSTVEATITSINKSAILIAPVTVDLLATGSDLPNGLIIVKFTSAQTSAILDADLGRNILEVQVNDPTNGKQTYSDNISVAKGTIA